MPEEKVSKRNNPDVSEWGSSGYIPVLPKPAADAGPGQAGTTGICKHCLGNIYFSGSYWYHAVTSGGRCGATFAEPSEPENSCDNPSHCHNGICRSSGICQLAVPPVPQEAAPRPDCEMWSSPESVLAFDDELNGEADAEHGQSSEELGHSFAAHFKPAPPETTRQDEPLKALRQWEADTEAPANASEGNAFIDGFNAGREAGSERERKLEEKLQLAVNWISHGRGRTRCIICDHLVGGHSPGCEVAEASRLLGGESK